MSNVGYATLTIIPSALGFSAALGGQVNPATSKLGTEAGGLFGGTFGKSIMAVAAPIAALFGAAAIGGFVKSAIAGASDLEQSIGAIDAIFKGSAGQMHDWAGTAATTVGLTKNEYNTLGALLGAQLKNGGTSMDQLAGKTNSLIGVAADLSAQFGGSTSQAVEALSSALKGERDPIEKYGVSLNQAKIDAEAAALGFQKVGGTLSTEATQAATLSLIMKQTADAHGAFGRETDTLAHKQQVLNAMWEDGKAKIGSILLPAVSALASGLIGVLGPALDGTVGFLSKTSAAIELFVGYLTGKGADVDLGPWEAPIMAFGAMVLDVFDGVKAAIAPFMPAIKESFGALGPQIAQVLPLFSPFSLILRALIPVLPQIAGLIASLAAQLGPVLGTVLSAAVPLVGQLVSVLSGVFVAVLPVVADLVGVLAGVISALVPAILPVVAAILPLVSSILSALMPALTAILPIFSMAGQIIGALVPILLPIITTIAGLLIPIINALLPVVTTVFGVIADVIKSAMTIVQGVIDVVLGILTGDWDRVWKGLGEIVSGVWNTIVSIVQGAIGIVGSVISAALSVISTLWNAIWNGITSFFSGIWNGLVSAASHGLDQIIGFFTALPGNILKVLTGIGDFLVDVGRNMVEGLLNGIKAVAGKIGDALLAPIKGAVNGVKAFLGIHSPSRLLMGIGEFTGEGMAIGLRNSAGLVADASEALIPTVPSFSSPDVQAGGLTGALAAAGQGGDNWTIEYNDHSTSSEDKQAKLLKAQTILEQSVAARKGR